jgi:hypothetical protein
MPVIRLPASSRTPGVLVSRTSFLGLENLGDLAGDDVGVDVVGFAALADADRRHDRDEAAGLQVADQRRIDLRDVADLADVDQVFVCCPDWPASASWRG